MKFSIITICYNSKNTIERTIKSVLNLTYPNVEYVVVDGASKDGTLDVIKHYEPLFNGRMKWISEPDNGIYDAMNKGVRTATGDIIGIVNSDDWLECDALDVVYKVFKANGESTNALYCGGIRYHHLGGSIEKLDANIKAFKRFASLYIMYGIRHPATFVPRYIYDKIGLFNSKMKLSADQDFILRCYYNKGIDFVEIPEVLSNMSEGGISTEGSKESLQKSKEDRKEMLKCFNKKGLSYYWLYYSWLMRVKIKNL